MPDTDPIRTDESSARPVRRGKYFHPMTALFLERRYTVAEGMNWLQERGLVSDLCNRPEEVAPCDVVAVLARAGRKIPLALVSVPGVHAKP
jgi:hypothetical protein